MVADARMFFGGSPCGSPRGSHASRRGRAPNGASLRERLADGSLGGMVLQMAADLATLGAAIDLALAEDEIDQLDDAAVDALLREMGLIPDQFAEQVAESFDDLFKETDEEPEP